MKHRNSLWHTEGKWKDGTVKFNEADCVSTTHTNTASYLTHTSGKDDDLITENIKNVMELGGDTFSGKRDFSKEYSW